MKLRRLSAFLVLVAAALSSRAEIQWKGFTISDGKPMFSLVSVEDQTSKWVSLGQSFAGQKMLSFDPAAGTLLLGNGDARAPLRLQDAVIKDSSAEDAKAALRGLSGMELAYELAKRGDVDVGAALKTYQNVLARLQDLDRFNNEKGAEAQIAATKKFLGNQADELRVQAEKMATAKAALLFAVPAKP